MTGLGRDAARFHRRRPDYGADVLRASWPSILPAMRRCLSDRLAVFGSNGPAATVTRTRVGLVGSAASVDFGHRASTDPPTWGPVRAAHRGPQEACDLDVDTLMRRRRVLGDEHPVTRESAEHLVLVLRVLGRMEDADRLEHEWQGRG